MISSIILTYFRKPGLMWFASLLSRGRLERMNNSVIMWVDTSRGKKAETIAINITIFG